MPDSAELVRFYENAYTGDPAEAGRNARWRALSALAKADHVIGLCRRRAVAPASTLDVGCGDGALLCELSHRGFGGRLSGVEIAQAAVAIARTVPGIDSVEVYDGEHLPAGDRSFELGVLSHVLEHVPDPPVLLAEVGRVCRAVVVEVPLEANLSASRRSKRAGFAEVGHLHRFDRAALHRIAARAGLSVVCELTDPLSLGVQRFFALTRAEWTAAGAKWALRSGLHRLSPPLAERLFTVHYACLCVAAHEP